MWAPKVAYLHQCKSLHLTALALSLNNSNEPGNGSTGVTPWPWTHYFRLEKKIGAVVKPLYSAAILGIYQSPKVSPELTALALSFFQVVPYNSMRCPLPEWNKIQPFQAILPREKKTLCKSPIPQNTSVYYTFISFNFLHSVLLGVLFTSK